jgi:hypothetical protein
MLGTVEVFKRIISSTLFLIMGRQKVNQPLKPCGLSAIP